MPFGISLRREKKTVIKESETLTPVEIENSICENCDAFPEGTKIVYNNEDCPKGYLKLKNKITCISYNSRVKQEKGN